jgi:hypothetical protein
MGWAFLPISTQRPSHGRTANGQQPQSGYLPSLEFSVCTNPQTLVMDYNFWQGSFYKATRQGNKPGRSYFTLHLHFWTAPPSSTHGRPPILTRRVSGGRMVRQESTVQTKGDRFVHFLLIVLALSAASIRPSNLCLIVTGVSICFSQLHHHLEPP